VAVASAGPYAKHLHVTPDGQMLFLTPNQQCQSTEGRVLQSVDQKPADFVLQLYSLFLTAASKELSLQSEITSKSWISSLKKGIETVSRYDVVLTGPTIVCGRCQWNSNGVTSNGGAKCCWARWKLAIFNQCLAICQKCCKIGTSFHY